MSIRMKQDLPMMSPYLAIGATILMALGVASCDSRKPNAFQPPTTPSPPVAGLRRVELIAPESIAPGESVQLTANAVKSDDSVENVSGRAQWMSQDPRVIEISSTGVAKGIARGEALIRVTYQGWNSSTRTFVLPAGTHRLNGTVSDGGGGVAGVTVTIVGGVGEALTTITDGKGTYALYGVRDRIRLLAKGTGYLNRIEEIDVADHRTFDFDVIPEGQRTDLRGRYALTVARMPCPGTQLPETRSYDATVTQDGPRLTVTLSGADFVVAGGRGNAFSGFIDAGNRVTFIIGDPFDYYNYGPFDLVERIDDARVMIISGSVTAGLSSTGISGTLSGTFLLAKAEPFTQISPNCYGTAHRFEMVRR